MYAINEHDVLLKEYIATKISSLDRTMDAASIVQMKKEIETIRDSVSSAEVRDAKLAAVALRSKFGGAAKADLIERALCDTPLASRGSVISHNGPANNVQKALASHRFLGGFRSASGQINQESAANTFKRLKLLFTAQAPEDVKSSTLMPKK